MKFLDKANLIVKRHITARYSKIIVQPGKCRYNFHCHSNAVNDAVKKSNVKIALVVYFDKDCPVVHFVNVKHDGTFKDNTLGYWCKYLDYYFIRWIPECEFDDVYNIHQSLRYDIKKVIPWYIKMFCKFEA